MLRLKAETLHFFERLQLKFKLHSCIMGNPRFAIARIAIMLLIQFFCSFSQPLYVILTQMGSSVNQKGMSEYKATAAIRNSRIPEDVGDGADADADRNITLKILIFGLYLLFRLCYSLIRI